MRAPLSRSLSVLLGSLLIGQASFAELFPGVGATGQNFLKLPMTARPAAMAGAFTAVDGDAAAVEYNPAGVASVQRLDAQATYLGYIEDTSLQAITGAFPLGAPRPDKALVLGGQIRLFSSSEEGRDFVGKRTGDFDLRNQAFHGVGAIRRGPFSLGLSGAYVSEKIGSESRSNFLSGAGAQWTQSERLSVGVSLLNIGPEKAFISEKDPPPTTLRGGIAYRRRNLLITADGAAGRDKVLTKAVGGEVRFNKYIAVRAGALHHTDLEFTGGLGILFEGPAKRTSAHTSLPAIRPSAAATAPEPAPERRANTIERNRRITLFAQSLTEQYKSLSMGLDRPSLAVLPLNSESPSVGLMVADRLTHEFDRLGEFTLIERQELMRVLQERNFRQTGTVDQPSAMEAGRALGARFVLLGSVDKIEGRYLLNARLVETERGAIIATAYESLDPNVLLEADSGEPALEEKPAPRESRSATAPAAAAPPVFPNVDLGLDYAIRSQGDLGLSHTISLRLLY